MGAKKSKEDTEYVELLNKSIITVLKRALSVCIMSPRELIFITQVIIRQIKASSQRKKWSKKDLHVPSFMIMSVTNKCNLKCKGCYASVNCIKNEAILSVEKQKSILEEAAFLGISIVLIAGGEPLMQDKILGITRGFPKIIFPLFTNGVLINKEIIYEFKKQRNVIPIISLEGGREETDERRGIGVYQNAKSVFENLKENKIFFGVSITVTKHNFNTVVHEMFVNDLIDEGCKLFIFVEYVPVEEGTKYLELDVQQKTSLKKFSDTMWDTHRAIFITFPGDEEKFGGCLAAGRGFLHINASGDVEPCPFAPYSDSNLKNISLKEALSSELLIKIRENHRKLNESSSGCALWDNRAWVSSLLEEKKL